MAYENVSGGKIGSEGSDPGGNPGENPDINKFVYKVITPMVPFIADGSDEIMFFGTLDFDASTNTNKPGDTISTIKMNDTHPSDIIWWRGVSGTPGKFSNYRMVEDVDKYGVKVGIHFEATWDGVGGEPILPIDSTGIIEYIAVQPKTAHDPVIDV